MALDYCGSTLRPYINKALQICFKAVNNNNRVEEFEKMAYFENKNNHYESICSLGLILSKNEIPGVTDSLQVVSI